MDAVFFLKTFPANSTQSLAWPGPVKLVGVDPGSSCYCSGADPYCSTAYSCLWQAFKGADGRVLPNFVNHYAPGATRVAFVGFSAAHGFLNPLLNNDADRAAISAVVMLDTCFGGGKTGFQKALRDAANGKMLYATLTSSTGDPWSSVTDLTSGTLCFEKNVIAPLGLKPKAVAPRAPMPMPSGGSWQLGKLGFWLPFADPQTGHTELHHYDIKVANQDQMLAAYLIPYWKGQLGGLPSWVWALGGAALVGGAYWYWNK